MRVSGRAFGGLISSSQLLRNQSPTKSNQIKLDQPGLQALVVLALRDTPFDLAVQNPSLREVLTPGREIIIGLFSRKTPMKGMRWACFSSVVSAGFAVVSIFAIEALIPQTADAASVDLQCRMVATGGQTRQIQFTFNEAKRKVTITNSSGKIRRFDNAFITHNNIMISHKVDGVPFDLKLNRITGKAIRTRRGIEVASGNCAKVKKVKRKF